MPRLFEVGSHASKRVSSFLSIATLGLLTSACQLVVAPNGEAGVESDEAGATARACGERTCGEDRVCCNASCGICTSPGMACIQIACEQTREDESCSSLACGADEPCMETPAGVQCVPETDNPCHLLDCPPNTVCEVDQGAAACKRVTGGADAGAALPTDAGTPAASDAAIAATDAGAGKTPDAGKAPDAGIRRSDAGAPSDASAPPPDAGHPGEDGGVVTPTHCAAVLCPKGTYCDDISGVAQCKELPSCNTVRCSAGHHCELTQVQCIRAPCPPLPSCVPDVEEEDPCAGKCKGQTHCQVIQAQCIKAPCLPIAVCLPVACDHSACAAGSFCCCNACGSNNHACIDLLCPTAARAD